VVSKEGHANSPRSPGGQAEDSRASGDSSSCQSEESEHGRGRLGGEMMAQHEASCSLRNIFWHSAKMVWLYVL